jgi:fucose permease
MRGAGERERSVRGARAAVSAFFLLMGMTTGVWLARVPAVKAQANLSDGLLGVALFAVPVGLVIGAAAASRLVDRLGSARVIRPAGVGLCLLTVAPGFAHDLAELMIALLAIGAVAGTLDVAQNAQGVRVETAYGRPVMASMHACYSLGAIAGSLIGGAFAWAAIAPVPTFAAVGIPGAAACAIAGHWLLPGGAIAAGTAEPVTARPATREHASRASVRWLVLSLGLLGVCGLVCEGAAGDWSAVYLRDNLGTSAGFAALGYAAFSVTMTSGRLAGDRLAARLGAVRLVRWYGLVAAAGLAGGLLSRDAIGAVAGFAVLGAGLSCVVPQVFSAGGRADPDRPGAGLAQVVGVGYAGMAAGPAAIGAVASKTGLPFALGILVLLALWIAVAARVLGRPGLTAGIGGPGQAPPLVRLNDRPLDTAGRTPAYGRSMDDKEILNRIDELIRTEHDLRDQLAAGSLSSEQERQRLRSAEEALDQCWDLLRQRRARREFGENPDSAITRPAAEVEGYQQ